MTKADLFLRIFEADSVQKQSRHNQSLVDVNHLIRMHEWPREQANLHADKLFLRVFVLELRTEQDLNVNFSKI